MRLPVSSKLWIYLLLIFLTTSLFLFHTDSNRRIFSASPNIVISEIQASGTTANDEFVELYNPTSEDITMANWRLSKRTASINGTISNLVSNLSGTIAAHGYLLVANHQFTGTVTPDVWYSATTSGIAANNTVILYSDTGQTVVDKVGLGTAEDNETMTVPVPQSNTSVERKAVATSTYETMGIGGLDEFLGNGFDSDNNNSDFLVRTVPQPQNSSFSEPEVVPTLTVTIIPTITPLPTLIPTTTPLPTIEPTSTPTPIEPTSTPVPTSTPTTVPTNTPLPTAMPTLVPTLEPTSTPVNTPTPTRFISPTPTPISPQPGVHTYSFQCKTTNKTIRTPIGNVSFPLISCKVVKT